MSRRLRCGQRNLIGLSAFAHARSPLNVSAAKQKLALMRRLLNAIFEKALCSLPLVCLSILLYNFQRRCYTDTQLALISMSRLLLKYFDKNRMSHTMRATTQLWLTIFFRITPSPKLLSKQKFLLVGLPPFPRTALWHWDSYNFLANRDIVGVLKRGNDGAFRLRSLKRDLVLRDNS